MAVRSTSWTSTGASATWAALVTCPAGRTALVKTVVMYSWAAATQQVHLAHRRADNVETILHRGTIAPDATLTLSTLIVLKPGESLRAHVGGSGYGWQGYAAGALLLGAPA